MAATDYDARFRERLRGRSFGDVVVDDVRVEPRLDSDGNEYHLVTLILEPPVGGSDTWSLDDVDELTTCAWRVAAELELDPVSLITTSSGDAETSDEDAGAGPTLDLGESLRRGLGGKE